MELLTPNTTKPTISEECSTPYVSAPSSPTHTPSFFYYSVPSSPMHHFAAQENTILNSANSFEFESNNNTMSSADELFLNGKIRPMKLSTHLQTPQALPPLVDVHSKDTNQERQSRVRMRDMSLTRRTRSLSPLRNMQFEDDGDGDFAYQDANKNEDTKTCSRSKRWVFLKDFLRSKSEGRSNNKFWSSITFSPAKDKKPNSKKNAFTGPGKRRVPVSAHELHYTANRAQAEEMRRKTYLPYRQGLFGCLGFSSRGYGAFHGFARALNPVSSR